MLVFYFSVFTWTFSPELMPIFLGVAVVTTSTKENLNNLIVKSADRVGGLTHLPRINVIFKHFHKNAFKDALIKNGSVTPDLFEFFNSDGNITNMYNALEGKLRNIVHVDFPLPTAVADRPKFCYKSKAWIVDGELVIVHKHSSCPLKYREGRYINGEGFFCRNTGKRLDVELMHPEVEDFRTVFNPKPVLLWTGGVAYVNSVIYINNRALVSLVQGGLMARTERGFNVKIGFSKG